MIRVTEYLSVNQQKTDVGRHKSSRGEMKKRIRLLISLFNIVSQMYNLND